MGEDVSGPLRSHNTLGEIRRERLASCRLVKHIKNKPRTEGLVDVRLFRNDEDNIPVAAAGTFKLTTHRKRAA